MQLLVKFVMLMVSVIPIGDDAAQPPDATDRPPALVGDPAPEAERCRSAWSQGGRVAGEIQVQVWIDATGKVTGMATPPDADPLSAQAAQCAVLGLRFEPAKRAGHAVAGQLIVPIGFVTPPLITRRPGPRQERLCYPASAHYEGREGRVEVEVTIDADGKLVSHSVPDATEAWLAEAGRCMVQHMEFEPGLARGVPVRATGKVPVFFKIGGDGALLGGLGTPAHYLLDDFVEPDVGPKTVSTEEEIIAAYRECYPEDHAGSAEVTYEIRVERAGRISNIEVANSSGDPRLDEAGICILRKLEFQAATVEGRAVRDTVHWPLLVRPPP
jgi:TonB family protein